VHIKPHLLATCRHGPESCRHAPARLPTGRWVRPAVAGVVSAAIVACSPTAPSSGSSPPSNLVRDSVQWRLTADLPNPVTVELRLGIKNLSQTDSFIGTFPNSCFLLGHIEAYSEGKWDQPVFDLQKNPLYYQCPGTGLSTVRLAPGDSIPPSKGWSWLASTILGDSLSPGMYRLGAHSIPVQPIPDSVSFDDWWSDTDRIELVAAEPLRLER